MIKHLNVNLILAVKPYDSLKVIKKELWLPESLGIQICKHSVVKDRSDQEEESQKHKQQKEIAYSVPHINIGLFVHAHTLNAERIVDIRERMHCNQDHLKDEEPVYKLSLPSSSAIVFEHLITVDFLLHIFGHFIVEPLWFRIVPKCDRNNYWTI